MADLNKLAQDLFGTKRIEGAESTSRSTSTISGTATGNSSGGSVNVVLTDDVLGPEDADGNQTGTTSVEVPSTVDVQEGDDVVVSLIGPDGSKTPIVTGVVGGGDRIKVLVIATQEAADAAEAAAAEAYDAVEAIDQHFFADSNGVHVATTEGDADTGPNLLANSLGILLRDGTLLRTAQTASGFAVYDGNGNQAGNIVALLGPTSVIGKPGNSQLTLSPEALALINAQNDTVFHAGTAQVSDGQTTRYVRVFIFGDGTATGSNSASFGLATVQGDYSFASGVNTGTRGYASQAFGDTTVAESADQLVCGRYNIVDTNGDYLFIVGNGSFPSTYSNAFAVGTDGKAYAVNFNRMDGGKVPGEYDLYNSTATSSSITLSDTIANYDRLRIYFQNTYGVQSSTEIRVTSTTIYAALTMNYRYSSSTMWAQSHAATISGTSISRDTPMTIKQTASGNTVDTSTTAALSITRVVGIKD